MGLSVPQILFHPESTVNVISNEGVTLTCVVFSSPVPDVTWFRNGNQTVDNETANAFVTESLIQQSDITFVESILEICPVEVGDAGEYGCQATNVNGMQSVVFQVVVTQGSYPLSCVETLQHSSCKEGCLH